MDLLAGPLDALARLGLLMLHDATLPSVSALVAGEPVRGSWWGHRMGHVIYDVATALDAHPDALATKLVNGQTTFVHRRLAPALVRVGAARAPWQTADLGSDARRLLAAIDTDGRVRATGPSAREVERRLLALGREVHTPDGLHATLLVSWSEVARQLDVKPEADLGLARAALEAAALALGPTATLPWS